ncbi:MAG: hypothetical protein EB127_29455, partial [Alphaproteobacteria bacterium]|nr:hypothetical protein [Alphaproteobacteria bacterium]
TLTDDDRIDRLSKNYYENPGYSWLVWLANETIDPYYGLSVTDLDLVNLIKSKYGSLEAAARKIRHYRIDWINDTTELTPEQYNSWANDSFNGSHIKYFEVVLDSYGLIKKYVRKQDDSTVSTNQTVIIALSDLIGTFIKGEEIQIDNAYAFVKSSGINTVTVQHTVGFPANLSYGAGEVFDLDSSFIGKTITGRESGATATIISGSCIKTIAEVDNQYWSPVTYLDYEYEENTKKKYIQLIGSQHKNTVEEQFKRIMKRL